MRGLLRTFLFGILIFAVVLAAWKLFGGDIPGFFNALWGFIYTVVDALSNVLIQAWHAVFG